jgi:hypothetical protein
MEKKCFKCKLIKPIDDFYKHKETRDGYLNKCKVCAKKDVRRRYYEPESRAKIRDYEQRRFKTAHRKQKLLEYQRKRRASDPVRRKAYSMVSSKIARGKLAPQPCSVCGMAKTQAHHKDYNQPLQVEWLCFKHHREAHGQRPF